MAKKRRQKTEKKDEMDIKLPEFDEHEYIALELRKSKLAFASFIFAILMVIVTYFLYTVTYPDWRGPIVLGILAVVALPFIVNFIKLDTSEFDWKNWFGGGAIYVLSWLAIFVLVVNPPFSDFAGPEIDEDEIEFTYLQSNNSAWIFWEKESDFLKPTLTDPIRINVSAEITDNNAVDKDSVKLIIKGKSPVNYSKNMKMEHIKDNYFRAIFNNNNQPFTTGLYTYSIEAKDINGHKKVISGDFRIN